MTMRVSKEMCNAIGVLHGGALMSFCAPCHSLGGDFVVSSINFMEKFDGLGLGNLLPYHCLLGLVAWFPVMYSCLAWAQSVRS